MVARSLRPRKPLSSWMQFRNPGKEPLEKRLRKFGWAGAALGEGLQQPVHIGRGWMQMGGSQFGAEMCSCPIAIPVPFAAAAALAPTQSEDVQEKNMKQQPEVPGGKASMPLKSIT